MRFLLDWWQLSCLLGFGMYAVLVYPTIKWFRFGKWLAVIWLGGLITVTALLASCDFRSDFANDGKPHQRCSWPAVLGGDEILVTYPFWTFGLPLLALAGITFRKPHSPM
jgi:hypothetical protein